MWGGSCSCPAAMPVGGGDRLLGAPRTSQETFPHAQYDSWRLGESFSGRDPADSLLSSHSLLFDSPGDCHMGIGQLWYRPLGAPSCLSLC